MDRVYIAIDLKSFYASVECVERGLDPMDTNLVVADVSRTEKTICLAVSPSLKAYGIPGRARLFEVIEKLRQVNAARIYKAPKRTFRDKSYSDRELKSDSSLSVSYIAAVPRMAHYMEYSTRIYGVYLKYFAPEDIVVYSIDEVFIDATAYLRTYGLTPRQLAQKVILDVLKTTGITATAGIGTNLYLCKVAMDIVAKHTEADQYGVRIAELDEISYRRNLWGHTPLTDFWRVGRGYAQRLERMGLYTMGDIARYSMQSDYLYKVFGVNAELLIDHAWGYEPCTVADIKAYKPENNSLSSGQVLQSPYDCEKTGIVVREMADQMALDLVDKGLFTNQLVLTLGYDTENLRDPQISAQYEGEITTDRYGRKVPKHAHGSENLDRYTCSSRIITEAAMKLFKRIAVEGMLYRRITIAACRVIDEASAAMENSFDQLNLFDMDGAEKLENRDMSEDKEKLMQKAILDMKKKYGKNAVLKGMNLQEGATAVSRNGQIGGHKA